MSAHGTHADPAWDRDPAEPQTAETLRRALLDRMGQSEGVRTAVGQALDIAGRRGNILICGEPGSPFIELARAIHCLSPCARGPLHILQCADLAECRDPEPRLFGSGEGSDSTPGAFRAARGGTLVLDHVHLLPPAVQDMALMAIEALRRPRSPHADADPRVARVIATAPTPLFQASRPSVFTGALRRRLSDFVISLPPLHERPDDIVYLAETYRREANLELKRSVKAFAEESQRVLLDHAWPGGAAELRAVVFLAADASRDTISADSVRAALGRPPSQDAAPEVRTLLRTFFRVEDKAFGGTFLPTDANDRARASRRILRMVGRTLKMPRRARTGPDAPTPPA